MAHPIGVPASARPPPGPPGPSMRRSVPPVVAQHRSTRWVGEAQPGPGVRGAVNDCTSGAGGGGGGGGGATPSGGAGGGPASAAGPEEEGGAPSELTLHDGEVIEGDTGDLTDLELVVTSSFAPLTPVSFRFHTTVVGFGAEPGVDHQPVDVIVELPAGATEVTVTVPIIGDDLVEPDELFFANISELSSGSTSLSGAVALGRILDDDATRGAGGQAIDGGLTSRPTPPGDPSGRPGGLVAR